MLGHFAMPSEKVGPEKKKKKLRCTKPCPKRTTLALDLTGEVLEDAQAEGDVFPEQPGVDVRAEPTGRDLSTKRRQRTVQGQRDAKTRRKERKKKRE